MCADCDRMVALIRLSRQFPGSHVAYRITVPGNGRARLVGADGREIDPSGTEQLPYFEEVLPDDG
jgi:hypothetical protein